MDTMDGGPGVDLADYDCLLWLHRLGSPVAAHGGRKGLVGERRGREGFSLCRRASGRRRAQHAERERCRCAPGPRRAGRTRGRPGRRRPRCPRRRADVADCGSGTDTVTADLQGTDLLAGCENALFGHLMGGGATGRPSGSGGGPGPSATADTVAPRFVGRVRAVPARFRVQRTGTSFRYALTEAATVTFTIQRRSRGRRWRRIGAFRTRAAAGAQRHPVQRTATSEEAEAGSLPRDGKGRGRRRERLEAREGVPEGASPSSLTMAGPHEIDR